MASNQNKQSSQVDVLRHVSGLYERWNRESNRPDANTVEILTGLCEVLERETQNYFKTNPDPFGDRHPGRADPECTIGLILKNLLKNEDFITKLARAYLLSDEPNQHVVTTRLLVSLLPGLEAGAVFKDQEPSVKQLFKWAEKGVEPLSSYSIGILAYIMETADVVIAHKQANHKLVPMLLDRLHGIIKDRKNYPQTSSRPFKQFSSNKNAPSTSSSNQISAKNNLTSAELNTSRQSAMKSNGFLMTNSDVISNMPMSTGQIISSRTTEHSNSSWQDMEPFIINPCQIFPVTSEVTQRLIISYLTPLGEYTELLSDVFSHNTMDILFHYLDFKNCKDVKLSFVAVRYLAALLCHRKFGMDFIKEGGLEKLMEVHQPSLAATGASLCLYYISYFEDTMERLCTCSVETLRRMTNAGLIMLESSHVSGVLHAIMFISQSLSFKCFIDIFDEMDGLRRLLNVLTTSTVLTSDTETSFPEDDIFTTRQMIRYVTFAMKKYFEGHLLIKAEALRHAEILMSREEIYSSVEINPTKAMKCTAEVIADTLEFVMEYIYDKTWSPVLTLEKLDGIKFLFKIIDIVTSWPAYNGKAESIRWIFDILFVSTVCLSSQQQLCSSVQLRDNSNTPMLSILLSLADPDTDIICDSDVQKSALAVINNLVGAPSDLFNPKSSSYVRRFKRSHAAMINGENEVTDRDKGLNAVWNEFRQHNGIMVLLKLVNVQTPITSADGIRGLACKALLALSRSQAMCQIMSKLPLLHNGQLQQLMKEPVLQDKRQEHVKFCKYSTELIERVCGRPEPNSDITMEHIRRADIVAQTKIVYRDKELLQLIHDHLLHKGFKDSAEILQREASLPSRSCSTGQTPVPAVVYDQPTTWSPANDIPVRTRSLSTPKHAANLSSRLNSNATPGTPGASIKLQLRTPNTESKVRKSKLDSVVPFSSKKTLTMPAATNCGEAVTLDNIVTSYLRKQHASCKTPIVTCPPFSLYDPHKCPEPKRKTGNPVNIVSRLSNRGCNYRVKHGPGPRTLDNEFKFSRYKAAHVFKDDDDIELTCVSFADSAASTRPYSEWIMLGTARGTLKLMYSLTYDEQESYTCHNSEINHISPSLDGQFVVTSCTFGTPQSKLWKMGDFFEQKLEFEQDWHVELNKLPQQDRLVGTNEQKATLYDMSTGSEIATFYDENLSNHYSLNQATFSYCDNLILNDGVLWDINSCKTVHKFDKFNPNVSGIFHPLGLEVVINSEVWDLRTYRLLRTVPALDQCFLRFSADQSVMYAAVIPYDEEEDPKLSAYNTSFRTFDSQAYSLITTVDVNKRIHDLNIDKCDGCIAVIEKQSADPENMSEECVCRIYEVGALADTEEQAEEEEEAGGDDDDNDDDGASVSNISDNEQFDILDDMYEHDESNNETDNNLTDDVRMRVVVSLAAELMDILEDQEQPDLPESTDSQATNDNIAEAAVELDELLNDQAEQNEQGSPAGQPFGPHPSPNNSLLDEPGDPNSAASVTLLGSGEALLSGVEGSADLENQLEENGISGSPVDPDSDNENEDADEWSDLEGLDPSSNDDMDENSDLDVGDTENNEGVVDDGAFDDSSTAAGDSSVAQLYTDGEFISGGADLSSVENQTESQITNHSTPNSNQAPHPDEPNSEAS